MRPTNVTSNIHLTNLSHPHRTILPYLRHQAGLQSTRDQTFHNVAGAYAAILLGCVCQDNAEAITQARGVITVDDVDAVKKHLEDYLVFEQAAGMAQSTATVQRVMAVLSTFHS